MNRRRRRFVGAFALCALLAGTVSGCDSGPKFRSDPVALSCPVQAGGPVTLVVGARANTQRPQLPNEVQGLVREAAKQGHKIEVVRVDGVPTVAVTATFATNGRNQQIRDRDLANFVRQIGTSVTALQPKAPEADVLGALTEAAQITPAGGTIVLIDSGIPTTGPLSFQNSDMFGAAPTDVATFLASQHLLPDLSGRSLLLVGIGDTADPQPALAGNVQEQITALWKTVADKAGAACSIPVPMEATRTSISTTVAVTVVQPPPPPTFGCGTTVLADNGAVGFVVGTANFRDPAAAKQTLQGLADVLRGHSQQVKLIGTTSSEGTDGANQKLSEQRAAAVKAVLVQLGVAGSRITPTGAGEHYPDRVVDTTKDGVLIPSAAAHNRSVVVQLTCGH